ncbi:MAG: hypothetical protein QNJ37_09045 [Crocosphaera sp.]|nr:hypothetical protein [Crocosphaera sp.]
MNTIPNTTRLTALELLLTTKLNKFALSPVPLVVNCFLGEVLVILVESSNNYSLNLETIEASLYRILEKENLSQAYFIEIYYYINGKYCCLEVDKQPSLLEMLAWEIFDKDSRIFIKKRRDLIINWYQKLITSLNNHFKSNRLAWLVWGGSLGSLTLLIIVYGLTRPCIFDECLEIKQAQQLSDQVKILLEKDVSDSNLNVAKSKLELAIKLLNSIPLWSDYHQKSSQLKNKYQQELNNILSLNAAKITIERLISLSQQSPLSIEQLKEVKQEYETAVEAIELISKNGILDKIDHKNHQQYLTSIEKINNKIDSEKQGKKHFKQAEKAANLAQKRENSADQLSDLQLVYNTWLTAIKRLQEIQPETTTYESSRILLKTYLSNKIKIEKRKKQEEIAITMYNQANKYAEIAKKAEKNNQWKIAVNYWNMAVVYIKKIPQNTFKWNQIQPLIPTYNLSLSQATNKLKIVTEAKAITSELDALCFMKQKICNYKITETSIKMQLESHYLEQVWMTAVQAKAEGNLQIQVELLNHLSTFEHRLQTISNQTNKSIEVYNPQGNLMTVYHRQQ